MKVIDFYGGYQKKFYWPWCWWRTGRWVYCREDGLQKYMWMEWEWK